MAGVGSHNKTFGVEVGAVDEDLVVHTVVVSVVRNLDCPKRFKPSCQCTQPCLCEAAIWSSERVPMIQSMNTRNRVAWMASVFDLVVDVPQSGFLHRQRGVPLAVLPLRFIGPWQTGQFGLGVLIQ